MDATIRDIVEHPERWGQPFELTVEPRGASASEIEAALNANPEVEEYSTVRRIDSRIEGDSASVGAFVLDGDLAAYEHSVAAGRMFSAPGEAVVGQALLDLSGKEIGDQLRIFTDQGPLDLTIVGRFIAAESRGRAVLFGLDTYTAAFGAPTDSTQVEYNVRLVSGADKSQVANALAQTLPGQATVSIQDRADVNEIRAIIYTLDVILVIIGIVNILTTTMLGVRERIREVGVLKAVGSTPLQTMTSVLTGVCALALLAALVGLPLGLGATRLLFNELGQQVGVGGDLGIMPGPSTLAIVFVLSIVIVILGGLLPARHASMIRVTDALRHE
jgi:putative ABC transport system permease protein